MVKRYRMKTENYNDTRMHIRNTGEWVKYEDYAALKEQHRVLVSEVLTRVPVSNSAYWIAKECNLDD